MSHNIPKIKLNKFSLFSICSREFGYGHYNRVQNLISILNNQKNNKKIFSHFSYGKNYKQKSFFLKKLNEEVELNKNIILDFTNDLFLDSRTVAKIKKILNRKKKNKVFIIDSPTKKNLSTILNLDYVKTLIPFEMDNDIKRNLSKIKKKKFGFQYFIYSNKNLKKKNKIFDVTLSFGGSDNYEGTFYVLKLLSNLKIKKKVIIVIGKYFKKNYINKILSFSKKNNFKIKFFSKNFNDILNKTKILITNSGLTKYEGVCHGIPVLVFSDTKISQKIDKVFINKTKQFHFSYLKKEKEDKIKLKNILNKKFKLKSFDKYTNKSYMNKIRNFFYK